MIFLSGKSVFLRSWGAFSWISKCKTFLSLKLGKHVTGLQGPPWFKSNTLLQSCEGPECDLTGRVFFFFFPPQNGHGFVFHFSFGRCSISHSTCTTAVNYMQSWLMVASVPHPLAPDQVFVQDS